MSGDLLKHRWVLAAAVGAGVALGAASVFAYHQVHETHHREHENLIQRRLDFLNRSINEMKEEIGEMKKKKRRRRRAVAETDTESRTDFDEEDDDEFYDFDDEDDDDVDDQNQSAVNEWKNSATENDKKALSAFEETIAKADPLLAGTIEEQKEAYIYLTGNKHLFPDDAEMLWRLSKASISMSIIYDTAGNKEKKKEYVYEAMGYSERAVKIDPKNPEAHKWYAISVGSRGDFVPTKTKIEDGFLFKQHIDIALKLNPDDGTLHYLLGRFAYEVSQLSWWERQAAKAFFAEPPTASLSEAIEHCERAEELTERDWKENRLLCAKCYIAESKIKEALRWLDKAAKSPVLTADDEQAEKEVNELLNKYSSYRS